MQAVDQVKDCLITSRLCVCCRKLTGSICQLSKLFVLVGTISPAGVAQKFDSGRVGVLPYAWRRPARWLRPGPFPAPGSQSSSQNQSSRAHRQGHTCTGPFVSMVRLGEPPGAHAAERPREKNLSPVRGHAMRGVRALSRRWTLRPQRRRRAVQ